MPSRARRSFATQSSSDSAAASIGLFAITAANAEGTSSQTGQGNPSGAQNMDTVNKGNPNTPSAGQTTGMELKEHEPRRSRSKKQHAITVYGTCAVHPVSAGSIADEKEPPRVLDARRFGQGQLSWSVESVALPPEPPREQNV